MKGVLHYEFLETGQTATAELYNRNLNKLNEVLDEKRPFTGQGSRKVMLSHDNARPYNYCSRDLANHFKLGRGSSLARGILAPSDYHLFWTMQSALKDIPASKL